MAVLCHIALNPLKQEKTAKCGVKRPKAAWDEDYLFMVLAGLSDQDAFALVGARQA